VKCYRTTQLYIPSFWESQIQHNVHDDLTNEEIHRLRPKLLVGMPSYSDRNLIIFFPISTHLWPSRNSIGREWRLCCLHLHTSEDGHMLPASLLVVWFMCVLCSISTKFLAKLAPFDVWKSNEHLTTMLHSSTGVGVSCVTRKRSLGSCRSAPSVWHAATLSTYIQRSVNRRKERRKEATRKGRGKVVPVVNYALRHQGA
jgi:hypothetical protein